MPVTSIPLSPLGDYRRTATTRPHKLHRGLDAIVNRTRGLLESRRLQADDILAQAQRSLEAITPLLSIPTKNLRARLVKHAAATRSNRTGDLVLPLATLAEAAFRTTHLRAHPEQLVGALAIGRGTVAEMATGEGKTLTIGIAAALAAWRGRPVHVVTANDYLVKRDRDWLTPFYELCGLSSGAVTGGMEPAARRNAYAADITYVTSKELVADFLRDRLQLGELANPARRLIRNLVQPGRGHGRNLVMRGLHTAIIDEADHILIDEAVTPLIISRQTENTALFDATRIAATLTEQLEPGTHYRVDTPRRDIDITPAGQRFIASHADNFAGIWRSPARREDLVTQALHARHFFLRDKNYIIDAKGKIVIVDEFTGRTMEQRTWKQGLHQAIEAKEGLELTPPSETLARLSFQRFFRFYKTLSGVTGTAREAASELWQIYRLPVITIPTHKPCIRIPPTVAIFPDETTKWAAVVEEIVARHKTGQPVLAGTRSVAASEHLASLLAARGLGAAVLNAVRHQHESNIVAEAGHTGKITIATNMAGRGTDIKITAAVEPLGGLHVIATEAHESGRIDRQLFGRCARQGQPGSCSLYASTGDELLRRFLVPTTLRHATAAALKSHLPGTAAIARAAVHHAQSQAQRIAYRQRQNVLRQDAWLDEALSFTGTQ